MFFSFQADAQSPDFSGLTDINGEFLAVNLDSQKTIIILASENSCTGCFETLEKLLNNFFYTKGRPKTILIVRMIEDISHRREYLKKYQIFSSTGLHLFDKTEYLFYNDSCNTGFFKSVGVCRTPAIILVNEGIFEIIKIEELFNGTAIRKRAEQKMSLFLDN